MTSDEKKQLQITACKVRMGIIEGTHGAKAGHPSGILSAADMFTYLYFKEMNIDPQNPKWEDRDRFVLSKGHTAPGLYATLANRGFFPVEDLPAPVRRIGVNDKFGHSGSAGVLLKAFGLTSEHIVETAKRFLGRA